LQFGNDKFLGVFERGYGGIAADGREVVQKLIDGLAALKIIEQCLKRDACPPKDRGASEYVTIYDNVLRHLHLSYFYYDD
jgi:hypothetical protein